MVMKSKTKGTGKVSPPKQGRSQAKKRSTPQRAVGSRESIPPADPLISPFIHELSSQYKAGTLAIDEDGLNPDDWSLSKVPRQFVPFIEAPSLDTLVEVLKTHRFHYWHPLTLRQTFYLYRILHQPSEWKRLGWMVRDEEAYQEYMRPVFWLRPDKATQVLDAIKRIVQAGATGLFPAWGIQWRRKPRKRGRKSKMGYSVPRFLDPDYDWTPPKLYSDWRRFRDALSAQLTTLLNEPPSRLRKRKAELKREVVRVLGESGPGWSQFVLLALDEEPVAQQESPEAHQDASKALSFGQFSSRDWNLPPLDKAIDKMLRNKMGRAGKEGKSAFLACAVFGILCQKTPDAFSDWVENYRKASARKKQGRSPSSAQ